MRIRISWGSGQATATLDATPTAEAFWEVLPLDASVSTWGDEVYFAVPIDPDPEKDARQVVDPGTVCFWIGGSALALPYGPTPISQGDECRLVAECNVLGKLEEDPRRLASMSEGDMVHVERLD